MVWQRLLLSMLGFLFCIVSVEAVTKDRTRDQTVDRLSSMLLRDSPIETPFGENLPSTHQKSKFDIKTNVGKLENVKPYKKDRGRTHTALKRHNKCDPISRIKLQTQGRELMAQQGRQPQEILSRSRRNDYYYDEDYPEVTTTDPRKANTIMEKLKRNWQKTLLVGMCLSSLLCCLCGLLCYTVISFCQKVTTNCSGFCTDICDSCKCRDPAYRNAKKLAGGIGIELDYKSYQSMKKTFEVLTK